MAAELCWFLGGALAIVIPGLFLSLLLRLGDDACECCINGCTLGFAMAVYLASAVSYLDLRLFYPLWGLIAAVLAALTLLARRRLPAFSINVFQRWLLLILLLVGVSRFAVALPLALPMGWDPAFHLILARKIQLAQHAIFNWMPFLPVELNYPTGSHVLIVVLSAITRLGLATVFKDLIPLLGVLTTAQMFVLARRITGDEAAALFASIAYGLWAWEGSIEYFRWGGLPNELGMLFFIAMLCVWLRKSGKRIDVPVMGLFFGGAILASHHVMVAAGLASLAIAGFEMIRGRGTWKRLLLALLIAGILDSFFVIPLAARVTTLHSTRVVDSGEALVSLAALPHDFGYILTFAAIFGLALWAGRRLAVHPALISASLALVAAFALTEYVIPSILRMHGMRDASPAFTPSRFLTDFNYFLPIYAGAGIAWLARGLRLGVRPVSVIMMVLALTLIPEWKLVDFTTEDNGAPPDPGYARACAWISRSTPPSTVVFDANHWTTYLAWRRTIHTPVPVSEPVRDRYAELKHVEAVIDGRAPPDAPDEEIVQIIVPNEPVDLPVLWHDRDSPYEVVKLWPLTPTRM